MLCGIWSHSCLPRCVLPHYFFLPEEEEPSQASSQASDGSSPGKTPQGPHQGPHQGPDGSGSDPRDPPKSKGSNFYRYAGNGSPSTSLRTDPHPTPTAHLNLLNCHCQDSLPDGMSLTHSQKKVTAYRGDEINDALESEGPHLRFSSASDLLSDPGPVTCPLWAFIGLFLSTGVG